MKTMILFIQKLRKRNLMNYHNMSKNNKILFSICFIDDIIKNLEIYQKYYYILN